MNNPIDFEQDDEAPPGTGVFKFQDGSSLYAMDEELAARISQSAGPQMAAAPRDAWYDDPQDPVQRPGETAADFTTRSERLAAEATPKELAPLPTGKPAPAPAQGGPTTGPDGRIMPQIDPFVTVPGVDPRRMRATAVPVPQTTSTVTERGAPYSPEMAGLREMANQRVVEAKMAEFEAQRVGHERQATAMAAALPELRQRAAEANAEMARKQDVYQQERGRVHKYIEQYDRTARVNPSRIYEEGYGTAGIAMVIGQALGAYAATLAGGDNWAQRIVEQKQAADLAAQRENIQQGRIGIDNMLARLRDEYGGDMQQAESAWKILQSEVLDREIQSYAEAAKSDMVDRAAAVWLAQNQEARLREEQKFMELSLGKQTQTQTEKFITPQAGGRRLKTRKEIVAELREEGDFQEQLNRYNAEMHGGKPTPQDAKARLEARKEEIAFGDKWRDTNSGAAAIEDYARAMGLKIDWDTGEVARPDGDLPGVGVIDSNINPSDEAQNVQQRQQKAVQRYRQAMSGAAFSPQEAKEYAEVVTGGWGTERGALRGIEMMVNDIRENRRYLRSTYGDEAYERYLEKERGVNQGDVRRSQKATESGGRPY